MLAVQAFGEEGRGLEIPGPLVRVPAGTTIDASIRNALDVPLVLHGFWLTTAHGSHDLTSLKKGLYGALIVLEPGQKYDLRPITCGSSARTAASGAPPMRRMKRC